MITKEIIVNFIEGRCDARDVAIVQAWIDENPAKWKEYIGAGEWEDFQPDHVLAPELSGKLWNNINKNRTPPSVHYSSFRWMVAAASVILVAGMSWYLILGKQKANIISAASPGMSNRIDNNTPQKTTIRLGDGSTVELLPNSTLSYSENFNSFQREVILNGEANFNIAKDAGKPFLVYSHSVLITVLGTRFTVKAYESGNATKIILHEGRIKIKISDPSSYDNKNEYYLTPGDILISKGSQAVRVLHLEKDKDGCYVFNNYPLDVVFDQLQIIYNTKIIYDKADLGNRSFIGRIDKKDPLYHILQSIAVLNNFHLHQQGDSLIISN